MCSAIVGAHGVEPWPAVNQTAPLGPRYKRGVLTVTPCPDLDLHQIFSHLIFVPVKPK